MGIIALEGLEFYSYHGYYPEETRLGNKFEVDVIIEADIEEAADQDNLQFTVDYEIVYKIIKDEMAVRSKLIETVAKRIILELFKISPQIHFIEVSIAKQNPPVGGICKKAKVILRESKK